MQTETNTQKNQTSGIASSPVPWRIQSIQLMENYRIAIEFKDGLKGVLDLSKLVMSHDAGVFTALRDQALFHQAYLDHGAVTWPGELDLAPDAMYDSIKKRHQYLHF